MAHCPRHPPVCATDAISSTTHSVPLPVPRADNVQSVRVGDAANVQPGDAVAESLYAGAGVIYAQSATAARRGSTTRSDGTTMRKHGRVCEGERLSEGERRGKNKRGG